jgi:para-nitrobenzyl esterase
MRLLRTLRRKGRLFTAVGALAVFLFGPVWSEGSSAVDLPMVKIDNGWLQGKVQGTVQTFLGIPYAEPPTGDLRWRLPVPASSWTGIREATEAGNKCVQTTWSLPTRMVGSEDCLFLNVYAPGQRRSRRAPVLVWFHGGGWTGGSSQDVDGHVFASQGVVVVTVNYRLGALGFFASPELDSEAADKVSGNFALRDQQLALRWVQKNIDQFGGDSQRVTISGQSAGALSNWIHLVAPSSLGLFSQVIAQSPVVSLHSEAGVDDARGVGGTQSLGEEESNGTSSHFVKALGCDTAADKLACLRAKPAAQVIAGMNPGTPGWGVGWGPVVDRTLLADAVPSRIRQGQYKRVPILTGGNWGESSIASLKKIAFREPLYGPADYERVVLRFPHGTDILAQYPVGNFSSPEDAYNTMRSEARICTNISTAATLAKYGPLYIYEFEDEHPPATLYDVEAPSDIHPQSFHTAEIAYVFQTGYPNDLRPGPVPFDAAQKALSDRMMRDWVAFVKTGRPPPNSGWKSFSSSMAFHLLSPRGDSEVAARDLAREHHCSFWFGLWQH